MNPTDQIIEATSILYTKIYQGPFFFFDFWSFNHLFSGFLLFLLLTSLQIKMPFIKILGLLLSYEIIEFSLTYLATNIFRPEVIKDQFTDVFIGIAGSLIGLALTKSYALYNTMHPILLKRIIAIITGMTFSFAWLVLSHPSICEKGDFIWLANLSIYFLWLGAAFCTILVFLKPGSFMKAKPWILYVLIFLSATVINYLITAFSEFTFNISWGNFTDWVISLKIKMVFMPFIPFLLVGLYKMLERLIYKGASHYYSINAFKN